jgi:hypothetical protein
VLDAVAAARREAPCGGRRAAHRGQALTAV